MKARKFILYLGSILIATASVKETHSQIWGESFITINYSPSQPVGTLRDFIDKPSWASMRVDFMNNIKVKWAAGFGSGFTRFYQRLPRAVYNDGSSDISAVQTRRIEVIPVLAKASYFHNTGKAVQWYAGVGVGMSVVLYDKLWGIYTDSDNITSFKFCLEPVAGAYYRISKKSRVSIHTGLSYMYLPFNSADISGINYVSFNLGARIPTK
jgi:hypothetical protein